MMLKLLKRVCLVLGILAAQHVGAFVLSGPVETWQTPVLDYASPLGAIRYYYFYAEPGLSGREQGAPKNFGEGSRLTTPIVTYGYDATFLEYFGAQGEAAVDAAFATLNALPSASSAKLANYLIEGAQQVNYTAQAMELIDMKSTVLYLMAEHMGLLGETHVFDLAARALYGTPVCDYEYFVINRNYDPETYNPSVYVNGRQYTYKIWDGCKVGVDVGDAIEYPLDTSQTRYSAVATGNNLQFGAYYLNFTRDDVGGLSYLYKKSNYAYQALDSNSVAEPFSSSWMPVNTTNAITGISNFDGLVGGVEKITFVKVNYDSQLNPGFTPRTYTYTLPYVTNSKLTQIKVTRTVTAPDVLFTAAFLVGAGPPITDFELSRAETFTQSPYVSPGAGVTPSTIDAPELIVLNNAGPSYYAYSPGFLDELNYGEFPIFNWGSFDGSTNAPIVFPLGSSLAALEAQVLEGGATIPVNEWADVLNSNTNTTTGSTGGTGGGTTTSLH